MMESFNFNNWQNNNINSPKKFKPKTIKSNTYEIVLPGINP